MQRCGIFWKVMGGFLLLWLGANHVQASELLLSPEKPKSVEIDAQAVKLKEKNTSDAIPNHRIAIKTNLIYDVLLMPSLELEWRINNRWSINVEGEVAWWKNDPKHQYYQIATILPEGRFWFKTKNPWHGHYVGIFAGGNWYDLEAGKRGVQGEAALVGVSYGYMWPVSRCLSFEAGIGIGYMYTKFEEYLPQDGCYVYQRTKKMHYFGPLKLKLGFVWRLWNTK